MRVPSLPGLVLLVLILLTACTRGDTPSSPLVPPMSDSAASYLAAALDIMQANALYRRTIDWPPLRARAVAAAGGAQTYAETYPAIKQALIDLGDHHSTFRPPAAPRSIAPDASLAGPVPDPVGYRIGARVGYLLVPGYVGAVDPDMTNFAQWLHFLIENADTAGICGWVVDLRRNTGGNMYPMLAGVGPILGEGIAGSFVDVDGRVATSWYYREGAAGTSPGSVVVRVRAPYRLLAPDPPVAVLYGPMTASAGEAIAISFRGRPKTRSFGFRTHGLSTANAVYRLRDGASLVLTVALDADRTGHVYGGAVLPDQGVLLGALDSATAWIEAQPGCT